MILLQVIMPFITDQVFQTQKPVPLSVFYDVLGDVALLEAKAWRLTAGQINSVDFAGQCRVFEKKKNSIVFCFI